MIPKGHKVKIKTDQILVGTHYTATAYLELLPLELFCYSFVILMGYHADINLGISKIQFGCEDFFF